MALWHYGIMVAWCYGLYGVMGLHGVMAFYGVMGFYGVI